MSGISTLVKTGEEGKLDYGKAAFIGLGFFVITATWSLYNSFVPIFLKRFIVSEGIIGFIMTLDNIAAITIQPYFGTLSDNTETRFGHRLPYLMIGVPIAAIFFALIPFATSMVMLLTFIVIMNLAMSVFRAPTVALMPDLTPEPLRSKANGVINLMGGLGAVFTYALGSTLYDFAPAYPFLLASLLMVGILLLFIWKLKEPARVKTQERVKLFKVIGEVVKSPDKGALFVLLAIFCWFFGFSGIEAFFTLYGKVFLGIKESAAAFSLSFFSLAFMLFAIPSGILAGRWGRRKTILTGIIGLLVVFGSLLLVRDLLLIRILLLIGGFFWAFININSYPMVVKNAGEKIGTYTGLYYFFSTIPAIISPTFVGFLIQYLGYPVLFVNSLVFYALAFIFMLMVRENS